MKKELREELLKEELDQKNLEEGSNGLNLSKLIDENKGIVKALGIASFLALAGYSASRLLKDKKLMKKIKTGLKNSVGVQKVEELLNIKQADAKKVVKKTIKKALSNNLKSPKSRAAVKSPAGKKSSGKAKKKAKA